MRRVRRRLSAVALLAAAGVSQRTAAGADERTDEKQACASAAEEAEQLRSDARLMAARERLLRCSRPACPAAVRSDCAQWMTEVAAAIPTVVLAVRDARGQDVLGALASVDGVPIAQGLDGKALEVDPGVHTFRFESGGAAVEQVVLVREGEKSRTITATLDRGSVAATVPSGFASSPPSPAASSSRISTWTWAFGGIGVAALGVGTYLELSVNAGASSLEGSCGHSCSHAEVHPLVLKQQVLGPIAFAVGALSLGLAGYTLL
ncbi:MAG TPA: hypothetical protein VK762_24385, partial [Polyangiaceae bacterium]|nr:hypothetical protein [Polyangiaceae bacterium]